MQARDCDNKKHALLKAGASTDWPESHYDTPLHRAPHKLFYGTAEEWNEKFNPPTDGSIMSRIGLWRRQRIINNANAANELKDEQLFSL